MSKKPNQPSRFDWRKHLPVHPAADAYPKVPHDRLVEIGESIRQNGLQSPIFIHAKGNPATPDAFELFDGVTRLDAMAAVGIKFEFKQTRGHHGDLSLYLVIHDVEDDPTAPTTKIFYNLSDAEIADKVESANLHRRHLEPEQYRARIEASHARIKAALEREPEKSDRAHAEEQGVSDKTIAKVRKSTAEGSAVGGKRTGKDGKSRTTKPRKTATTSKAPAKVAPAAVKAPALPTDTGPTAEERQQAIQQRNFGDAVESLLWLASQPSAQFTNIMPSDDLQVVVNFLNQVAAAATDADAAASAEAMKARHAALNGEAV